MFSKGHFLSLGSAILLVSIPKLNAQTLVYELTDDISGEGFFNAFDFFTDQDPTNGFVQ